MSKLVYVLIGVILASTIIGIYIAKSAVDVDTSVVDAEIQQGIASADEELMRIIEHKPEVIERVEVIRYETSRRVFALDPDALVSHALERAERFRGRLAASDDSKGTHGVVGF